MKTAIPFLLTILTATTLNAENKATAEWITESETVIPGQAFRTVIRMKVDEGWHTYWENPGEAGLPLKIKAELPEGWSIGEIQYPVPQKFMTGELHGFGFAGEELFPVTLTPPAEASGKAPALKATLTWLTCDDSSCVPGKSELVPVEADPTLVASAYEALPKEIPAAKLSVISVADNIQLALNLPADSGIDPSLYKIFPASPDVFAPSAELKFVKNPTTPNQWLCSAPKNEYLEGEPELVTLVLASNNKAFRITSESEKK